MCSRRLNTAGLVLLAFSAGHIADRLGASFVVNATIGALLVTPVLLHRRRQQPTDQAVDHVADHTTTENDSGRTAPTGVNAFDVVCSPPPSESALAVIQDVIDGMVRPTDLVVRHTDGRLLVLVDAEGDHVRESFESRANVHVHVALAAAGMSPVGLTLRPVDSGA